MSSSPDAAARRSRGPLPYVLLALLAVLAYGWWLQPRPHTLEAAVEMLVDGDADRAQRLACLEVVRDTAAPAAAAGDVAAGLQGAMAALALGDVAGYGAAVRELRGRTPYLPGGQGAPENPQMLRTAALGEPYLRTLMRALAAENRSDRAAAHHLFREAQLSALFFGAREAAAEAKAGFLRTKG